MPSAKNKSVLFVVSGLGLGNSTRCLALIEKLTEKGISCDLASSGHALDFFEQCPYIRQTIALKAITYSRLTLWHLILTALRFILISLSNEITLFKLIKRKKPDIVIYDSMYGYLPCLLKNRPILMSINNSDRIVKQVVEKRQLPTSRRLQFWLVEFLDYQYQKLIPDWVLSPWPTQKTETDSVEFNTIPRSKRNSRRSLNKFIAIDPIVRKGIIPRRHHPGPPKVLIVSSGSGLGKDLTPIAQEISNQIGGVLISSFSPPKKKLMENIQNNIPLLNSADILVINGGFSSLSEGLKRQVPMILVPLTGHSEQWVNAQFIADQRLGINWDESHCWLAKPELELRINEIKEQCRLNHFSCEGANQASQIIETLLKTDLNRNIHFARAYTSRTEGNC